MNLGLAVLFMVSFSVVDAELSAEMQKCRAIEDSLLRLQCFDRLAATLNTTSEEPGTDNDDEEKPPSEENSTGAWLVETKTNPINDETTLVALLHASEGRNKYGKPIGLVVRCDSRSTDIYIGWQEYLGSDAPTVTLRVDSEPPVRAAWSLSTDKQATFYRPLGMKKARERKVIEFGRRLQNATRLVAQVTPYNESPRTAIFDLSGAEKALEPAVEICKW